MPWPFWANNFTFILSVEWTVISFRKSLEKWQIMKNNFELKSLSTIGTWFNYYYGKYFVLHFSNENFKSLSRFMMTKMRIKKWDGAHHKNGRKMFGTFHLVLFLRHTLQLIQLELGTQAMKNRNWERERERKEWKKIFENINRTCWI